MSADQLKVWYSELIELAQPYEKVVLEEKCVFKEDNFFFFFSLMVMQIYWKQINIGDIY